MNKTVYVVSRWDGKMIAFDSHANMVGYFKMNHNTTTRVYYSVVEIPYVTGVCGSSSLPMRDPIRHTLVVSIPFEPVVEFVGKGE